MRVFLSRKDLILSRKHGPTYQQSKITRSSPCISSSPSHSPPFSPPRIQHRTLACLTTNGDAPPGPSSPGRRSFSRLASSAGGHVAMTNRQRSGRASQSQQTRQASHLHGQRLAAATFSADWCHRTLLLYGCGAARVCEVPGLVVERRRSIADGRNAWRAGHS